MFRLACFTHVQIPCLFSRQWRMKKGISIHSTAKSYTVYQSTDRYLEYFTYYSGSSSAVWTYFLDQNQQKTHSSAFHITQGIYTLERCTLVFKTWCYFTCACLLQCNDLWNSSFSVELSILKETKHWRIWG